MAIAIGVLVISWFATGILASFSRSLQAIKGSATNILSENNDGSSQRLLRLIEKRHFVQLTLGGLIALFSVFFSVLAFEVLHTFSISEKLSPALIILFYIPPIALVLTIASRIAPKAIALRFPLKFCLALSPYIYPLHLIFSPISGPITRWFQKTLEYGKFSPRYLSGDDLKAMADMGEAHGSIEEDERELIHSIMDFGDTTVREVMVSRLDMRVISTEATLSEALDLIQSSGHSRLPLYEKHLDNILGIVYVKDLMPFLAARNGSDRPNWSIIAREALLVPGDKPLDDLLREFQSRKTHLAIVVDDYGGTAGLVTMEDLLEEIVGDIRDEFDHAEIDLHEQIDEFTHVFDARIHLEELCEVLKIELDVEKYDFDTLGGLIFHVTGRIPTAGENFKYENMALRVESIHNHRIGRVRVNVHPPAEDKTMVA